MISLNLTGAPSETAAAYDLLAIIADPDKAKAHLDALVAEKQASLEALDSARKVSADAKQTHKDAVIKNAEAKRISDEFNATHATRAKQLDDHSDALAKKQAQLEEVDVRLTKREADFERDLSARENAVRAREADVTDREAKVRKTGEEVQLLKETYERKVAALQAALASGPVHHVMPADTGLLGASMGEAK